MDISCAFPPVPATPEHIALAEGLGYRRAWVYDTPALQLDVWATLARAAERTARIELGPAAIIPSLRHPMVTAAAIATLVDLAPGRVNVVLGSGFTGRVAMGKRPLRWSYVADYARQLRALLAGKVVEADGSLARMLHGPDQAPARPITVPTLFAIAGPKGEAVARELGDGVFVTVPRGGFPWTVLLAFGTVLEPGEPIDSERALAAAGPGAAVAYHAAYEQTAAPGLDLDQLPGGTAWRAHIEALPARERHLHTHVGHLTFLNDLDRRVLAPDLVRAATLTAEAAELRERLAAIEAAGVTEIAYQPSGPDVVRELRAFAAAAGLAQASA